MKYRFRATRTFWRSFGKLPVQQQRRAREAFVVFKQNPFDPRLRSHKSRSFPRAMVASSTLPKSGRISEWYSTWRIMLS
jgi:hypothetical protein